MVISLHIPRPRKEKRNGAHLDNTGGIWNSSKTVAVVWTLAHARAYKMSLNVLTSSENYDIATNDCTLAVATVRGCAATFKGAWLSLQSDGEELHYPSHSHQPTDRKIDKATTRDTLDQCLMRRADMLAQCRPHGKKLTRCSTDPWR